MSKNRKVFDDKKLFFYKKKFIINCMPRPMKRPRRSGVKIYVPDAQKNKKEIREFLPDNFKKINTPIKMQIKFYLPYYYNISNIDKNLNENGLLFHISKPDLDNLTKTVLDAFNDYIWKDDSLVYELHTYKYYSDEPRIEVILKWQKEVFSNKQKTMLKHRK